MKKNILIYLCFITYFSYGQIPYDSIDKKFSYEKVVLTKDSLSQQEVYKRGRNWITTKFYSADNMIQLNDKDFNILTGTGHIKLQDRSDAITMMTDCVVTFKFSIYCKKSKYKYRIDNFRHSYTQVVYSTSGHEIRHDYEAALENISPMLALTSSHLTSHLLVVVPFGQQPSPVSC